ncbi:TTF-type domain-containing protein [Citrus sinensis]|nr:TTF-type domain-containing protein [Citrus sinensis]
MVCSSRNRTADVLKIGVESVSNQNNILQLFFERQSKKTQSEYETLLNVVVDCNRFLLNQGLAFYGHDKSDASSNKGNFLELLHFLADHNEDINLVTFRNTPLNLQMISPKIQKRHCKYVVEHFVGINHVSSTTAASLKEYLDNMFSSLGTSLLMLCGQGYDGQLTVISVAKKHKEVNSLFNLVLVLVNIVGVSAKCRDILHKKHAFTIIEALGTGELLSGQGLNQEITLKRPVNTRWSSYYGTLTSIISMFPYVVDVLEIIEVQGNFEQRFQAKTLLKFMQSFDFVFCLFLMKKILGYANELSRALQKKRSGYLECFSTFCNKHDIDVLDMDDLFLITGRSRRKDREITNLYRYQVELFYAVLDMHLQELNNHFNESNMELPIGLACLCPNDLFAAFDKEKLQTMVKTKKDKVYLLVYQLVTLALILPVVTATVERVFSAINFVKNRLRNRMSDQWLNNNLVVYIKKKKMYLLVLTMKLLFNVFKHMKTRREQLKKF